MKKKYKHLKVVLVVYYSKAYWRPGVISKLNDAWTQLVNVQHSIAAARLHAYTTVVDGMQLWNIF